MQNSDTTEIGVAADFLRITPKAVQNLLDNGQLNGLSSEDLKSFVAKNSAQLPTFPAPLAEISPLVNIENIIILEEADKATTLATMLEMINKTGNITDIDAVRTGLHHREELMSTGIGYGVAIPHVRTNAVKDISLAVCVVKENIADYESLDHIPVHYVFMIIAREDQHAQHLRLLSQISRSLKAEGFLQALKAAPEGWSLKALLTGKE